MKKFLKNLLNTQTIFLGIIVLISFILKILEVKGYNFAFTMDQGRDMVDIRHMVVTLTPRLVGPTTSINGVLLGPFWYYFNLLPFIVGRGDPSFIVYWQIIWYQISAVLLWCVLKKKSFSLAFISTFLYLFMPTGFNTVRYFWNANSMPFVTCIYFVILLWTLKKTTILRLLSLGLIAGLAMQIEAAFGILLFPFAFLTLIYYKNSIKNIAIATSAFFVTLIPQAFFEARHGFLMTKIFIAEFTGKGEMLGEKISMTVRLPERWALFVDLLRNSNHLPEKIVFLTFIIAFLFTIFLLFKKKRGRSSSQIAVVSLSFILFSAIFYILFPQKLKNWYTLGLSTPIILFLASFLNNLFESKNIILKSLVIIFLFGTFTFTLKAQVQYIQDYSLKPSNDKSNMRNEIAAIDWIYKNAEGKGFKVYSYLPSVYDYPYHQLFWWYGTTQYGYQPFDIAYLPNQPEYIRDNEKLWTKQRPIEDNDLTFLIIEEEDDFPVRTQEWLGNFSKLCLVKQEIFPWHAQVRMLKLSCD